MFEMEPIGYMDNLDLDTLCSKVEELWQIGNLPVKINEKVIKLSANIKEHNRQFFDFSGICGRQ